MSKHLCKFLPILIGRNLKIAKSALVGAARICVQEKELEVFLDILPNELWACVRYIRLTRYPALYVWVCLDPVLIRIHKTKRSTFKSPFSFFFLVSEMMYSNIDYEIRISYESPDIQTVHSP